ncbi:hypothetical protein F2P56_030275 [Juglans regia]|uniref:Transcription factor WER-like n=3 Tax=Juglans regia TaxID=51240 RepID=A0A2I4H5P0_JUGRE|nr:transcription factor WER-like [Juglans regia]KAF5449873.1 hypothetical protein F2P56_030275 [Juglans regia]
MEVENRYKKGLWTEEEDRILLDYVRVHGRGKWNRISKMTGLQRCGKSCRLRWLNYLSPTVKRGGFSEEEEDLIIRLHNLLGNRWSLIAGRVPGRTDNQVKNHWNTHLCKKLGIKNPNKKVVGTSKKTHPALFHRVEDSQLIQTLHSTDSLDSKLCHDGDDHDHTKLMEVMESENLCTPGTDALSNNGESQWMMSKHFAELSPLFPVDYQPNLEGPGFLEFLDGFPLDLTWQSL